MEHTITLTGHGVRLVPLATEHASALAALVDHALWAGMTVPLPDTEESMTAYVDAAVRTPGRAAFAVLGDDGAVRGSTSLHELVPSQGRAEAGHTFYGRTWWGGRSNPACKLLLLQHAFETERLYRVGFRVDSRNTRSLAAMERLGAVREGVLRGARIAHDGSRGDTVVLSVLAPEWPDVRARLEARLG
ncbi:GNAT family N-acetyltransferase [Sanguibacter suaedae]|uniref:GNAT family N-acetyltransferase n=1 Tax=Sanguibacter suaedae TaxID=2795737 RepID=A0A934IC96_9MICO|nr:GNAT family protein [Sanguibacter suaedae]MBI9115732.1 GNAT family N-acetyltransferase [Sanguibacter suaedae]